jgi:hypothetical protein
VPATIAKPEAGETPEKPLVSKEHAMYTLEIAGKPVALIDADEQQARALVSEEVFKADMQRWKLGDSALWDGRAEFAVRPASPEEAAQFQGPDPHPPHGAENDEGPTVMFLVDAYDPDDLEED